MSQALSNLTVGSKVKFGSYSVNGEAAQPIVWTIVAKNHTGYPSNSVTLHTSKIIDIRCIDEKEPNNSNSDRQEYGNSRYSVSNLDQWLNKDSAAGKWYVAAHDADQAPDLDSTVERKRPYAERPGFLNAFTQVEKDAILSTTIQATGQNIDNSQYETIERKVFLPSYTEIGLSNTYAPIEGSTWGYYTDNASRVAYLTQQSFDAIPGYVSAITSPIDWWLRTAIYDDIHYGSTLISLTGSSAYTTPISPYGIRPALNLSNMLKVSDTTDSDGCYTFTWPSHPMPWVGGTEMYTENETRNVEVSMESTDDILTSDRQDELWDCKNYYENDSTGHNNHANFHNSSLLGMRFVGRLFTSNYIGTVITTKITFLKAIPNVKISKVRWSNWVEYYKNDTTLETDTIKLNDAEVYTITATKEQYGSDGNGVIIARDITIGNISVGDVLSFETKKEGTIDSTSVYNDLVEGLAFSFSSDPITLTETVPVQKTRGVNKPVSSIYAGVTATVPVYTETTTTEDIALSSATFTDFFSASNTGTTGTNAKGITWTDNSGGGLKLKFGNYGINSSTSMTTFTAQRNLTNVVIKGLYYTESRFDKITLTVAGTTVLNAVSGTSSTLTQRWTGSLSKGQTIVLKFVKDSSQSASNEKSTYFTLSCDPYQKTTVNKTQTGTETKLVDKKIIKGYVGGPDGKARLFFGGGRFSYTGEYTEQDYISSSGTKHKLYTLTGSGTLTVEGSEAQYWMCGGGAGGASAVSGSSQSTSFSGPGGAGGYVTSGDLTSGSYVVTIGAGGEANNAGNATSVGTHSANGAASPADIYPGTSIKVVKGASGGGSGVSVYNSDDTYEQYAKLSNGSGASTYPFGESSLKAHSAGGAGGGLVVQTSNGARFIIGGNGGTNGGDGTMWAKSNSSTGALGGTGGVHGGGNGGIGYAPSQYGGSKGSAATFYGSGGGGGGYNNYFNSGYFAGGAGYQGVVYIAIPPITTT